MNSECWPVPTTRADGYAERGRRSRGAEETLVHRIAWAQQHGPIPKGYEVHHTCLCRSCINPAHLELLTRSQHLAIHQPLPDLTHPPAGTCKHGHDWATNGKLNVNDRWVCLACGRAASARYKAKRHGS